MTQLTIRLLSAPAIERDGAPVAVDTRKATALLAYLAVTGRAHGREALAALLWPEYDDEHARAALRRTLSTLRAALDAPHLAIDRETVSLIPGADLWVDVAEFQQRLAACRTHGHSPVDVCPACLAPLAEAVALYRDDFLAGFTLRDTAEFDDWQFAQAEVLRGELAGALEKLARGHITQGDFASALAAARRWLALDPLREEAHRQVMRLYAWADQRTTALHQYRECVRILEQELGVAPLDETTELYEAIKGNRLPPADLTGLARPVRSQTPAAADLTGFEVPVRMQPRSLPLVGRATEWGALRRAYERYAATGFFVALEGEPGIGKTRLAEEFLAHARGLGAMAVTIRCYEGEASMAYGPVAEGLRGMLAQATCADRLDALPGYWLAEAARLLPELSALRPGLPPSLPLDAPGAQSRFFEGLRQVLAAFCQGSTPNILFFDDMHWADAASLDLLAYLARRLHDQPLFILVAWRNDERPTLARLRSLAAEAQRAGNAAMLTLGRLALADVLEMVGALTAGGAGLPEDIGGRLYHETEGLPFFLVAYLDAFLAGSREDWILPQSVRDLLHARLNGVPSTSQQLLQSAAVLGRSFDLETVQAISGRSMEETITALDTLVAQRLLAEMTGEADPSGPDYDFAHEKLRALIYEETGLARRRLLHGRAARALSERARSRHNLDAQAAQIGRHYRLAGHDADAAVCFILAGDYARSLYANAEALAHYQAALALGHPAASRLHEAVGDLHIMLGAYASALASYETAAALCDPDSPTLAQIEHKLGNLHARRGAWPAAETHFEAALAILPAAGQDAAAGRILADASLAAHAQGQTERASALAGDALAAAEGAADLASQAQAYNILGILARSRGNSVSAIAQLKRGLAIAEALPDPGSRIAALNNLALAHADGGDLAAAMALTEKALALCVEVGDRHREAALRNNLADLLHAAGREAEAMAQLKQAVVIFAEIGARSDEAQPEIWKLTEW